MIAVALANRFRGKPSTAENAPRSRAENEVEGAAHSAHSAQGHGQHQHRAEASVVGSEGRGGDVHARRAMGLLDKIQRDMANSPTPHPQESLPPCHAMTPTAAAAATAATTTDNRVSHSLTQHLNVYVHVRITFSVEGWG